MKKRKRSSSCHAEVLEPRTLLTVVTGTVREYQYPTTIPVAGWTVIPGGAVIPVTGQDIARSFSIRGRSSTGRKTRNLLWGLTLGHQPDFEYSPAPESDLGLFIAQVQGHVHSWLAIDETKPIYAGNLLEDYNDHYEHEMRP